MTDAEKIAVLKRWLDEMRDYPMDDFDDGYQAAMSYVQRVINE